MLNLKMLKVEQHFRFPFPRLLVLDVFDFRIF